MPVPSSVQYLCSVFAVGADGTGPSFALTLNCPAPAVTTASTGEYSPGVPTGNVKAPGPPNNFCTVPITNPLVRTIEPAVPTVRMCAPVFITPLVRVSTASTVTLPESVAPAALSSVSELNVKTGIVCAALPLKLTVFPVTVYTFVPGVNTPAIPTVPPLANVRAPVLLLVRLL